MYAAQRQGERDVRASFQILSGYIALSRTRVALGGSIADRVYAHRARSDKLHAASLGTGCRSAYVATNTRLWLVDPLTGSYILLMQANALRSCAVMRHTHQRSIGYFFAFGGTETF